MTAIAMSRLWRTWVVALALGFLSAPRVEAQFETPNRQFHNETAFPLDGRHRDVACESCHRQSIYKGTPTTCYDCHWVRRQDDRFRLQLGSQCEQCHRTTTWSAVRWDHTAMTGMPLGVAHRQLSCQSCHTNDTFRAAQTGCFSCHQQDYQATRTPNHAAAGFPTACETCHRVDAGSFQQARFDHGAVFPLVGVHAVQTCASCHTNNVFRGTSRECVGCHRPLYDRTTTPSHAAAGFPTTCENCHRPTDPSWGGNGGFNHSAVFPLVGVHAQQACASCHVNNVFRGTSRECVGCHRPLYDRTSTPNHAAAGFPTTCENCHRATDPGWRGAGFNHASVFALVGRHAQTACTSCHANNVYRGTSRDCVGCHRSQYDRTAAPNHASAGFPTTCDSCHRPTDTAWTQGTFNHRFPITSGPHRESCTTCHQGGNTQTFTCLVCHDHDRTRMDEKHKGEAGYRYDSLACYSCHPNGRH
jgi:hypothetical protein